MLTRCSSRLPDFSAVLIADLSLTSESLSPLRGKVQDLEVVKQGIKYRWVSCPR